MEEIWRLIPGYSTHMVSSIGRVKGLQRTIVSSVGKVYTLYERILSASPKSEYANCRFTRSGNLMYVHKLVALAFIPNPNNYTVVNHINGNKRDNRIDNLEWCTKSHDAIHAVKMGLRDPTKRKAKILDRLQVKVIKMCLFEGLNEKEISEYFKVRRDLIFRIRYGSIWSSVQL